MKHPKPRVVRIEGTQPGSFSVSAGSSYTSAKRAHRYVAEGRAEWTPSGGIRFRTENAIHREVVRQANEYRNGGMATRSMIQHLPVVGNIAVLTVRKRKAA